MSGQDFVRAARESDAAAVARIQVECWRTGYAGIIPDEVLAELTSDEATGRWRERWAEAIAKPPTSRHRVLVATTTEPSAGAVVEPASAGGRPERVIAGFASAGPASDEDRWPATDAELYELHVAPGRTGQGHGGRLLHAVADNLAEDRFAQVSAWVLEADTAMQGFLETAGWGADGAHSHLDMGARVPIVRLHTALEVPPE
ncbi:MAG TPA: GNAT family N-acetyltransferase [Streptosporangiaceae bacterium]|nr:GNAT family N-acetyltransferase [Streptosporangiaceae bacterium]